MKIACPRCQQGLDLTLTPGRHALKCKACGRGFTFVVAAKPLHVRPPDPAPKATKPPRKAPPPKESKAPASVPWEGGEPDAAPTQKLKAPSDTVKPRTLPQSARETLPGYVPPPAPAPLPGTWREKKQKQQASSEERTVMVPFPQAPAAAEPEEEVTLRPEQDEAGPPKPAPVAPRAQRKAPAPRHPPASRPAAGPPRSKSAKADTVPLRPPPVPSPPQEEASEPTVQDTIALAEGMKLGGYQLVRRIGSGGMGTVWLARQLSLDRDVAVKVLRPSLAEDPQFVYRFTQEAFAAAQLVHHNVVQIYDCGSDGPIYFFSMEYVNSESLLTLVQREGRLAPEVAAGYILQAARGLKFAHDRGMVHRDIKPDNLLLNRNGIVKVADLGLVKRRRLLRPPPQPQGGQEHPRTDVLRHPGESIMGTPAYMAPEQVRDPAKVDARADIYSLGCTFYHLLTGQPPFGADSAAGSMTQHVFEEAIPPEERVRRVPKMLSDLVMRMMAKQREERLQNAGELIRALETFLGVEGAVSFSPREEHANRLERCVQRFNDSRWARRRRRAVLAFCLLTVAGMGLAAWRWGALEALGVAAFAGATWLASFIVRGLLQRGTLFVRLRQLIFQAPPLTWMLWLLLLGAAGYGLFHFKLGVSAGALLCGALLCAIGFYFLVDRNVAAEREPAITEVEQMLRSMRLRGLEEGALRQFVCKYSGEDWEAFYEAIFGYDAKKAARDKWGRNDRGMPRKQYATWREPLLRGMDALQGARQRRRERRQLKKLERKGLKAQARNEAGAVEGLKTG